MDEKKYFVIPTGSKYIGADLSIQDAPSVFTKAEADSIVAEMKTRFHKVVAAVPVSDSKLEEYKAKYLVENELQKALHQPEATQSKTQPQHHFADLKNNISNVVKSVGNAKMEGVELPTNEIASTTQKWSDRMRNLGNIRGDGDGEGGGADGSPQMEFTHEGDIKQHERIEQEKADKAPDVPDETASSDKADESSSTVNPSVAPAVDESEKTDDADNDNSSNSNRENDPDLADYNIDDDDKKSDDYGPELD